MLADRGEQEQIKAILVQSMANILRKCLNYKRNFSLEGLIGITLDESEVFLVNINETIHNSGYLVSTASQSREPARPSSPTILGKKKFRAATGTSTTVSVPLSSTPKVPATTTPSPGKGKRTTKPSENEPPLKRTRSATRAEILIKEEPVSGDEAEGEDSMNGAQENSEREEAETYTIEPMKKRALWDPKTKKTKPRKSISTRTLSSVIASQPVFPEQSATDLGQFLSGMKPILRDIDDVDSNQSRDDNVSNQSDSLKIDTGSNDEEEEEDEDEEGDDGQPLVYIDHCIDGELSDNLNFTMDGNLSFSQLTGGGGNPGGACMLILDESDGVMCSVCNEIFADQTTCRRHMKMIHKIKVSYRCELCGKRFWHHGDYAEHKMVFHDGPGGYQCQQCGKMLLSKRGLKEHMQHHTGQFPYFCFKCMRGFGRKFEFTGHMKKHHPGDPIAKQPMNVQQVFTTAGTALLEASGSFCEEDLTDPNSPYDTSIGEPDPTHTIETITERKGLKVVIKKECKTKGESSTESSSAKADDSTKS